MSPASVILDKDNESNELPGVDFVVKKDRKRKADQKPRQDKKQKFHDLLEEIQQYDKQKDLAIKKEIEALRKPLEGVTEISFSDSDEDLNIATPKKQPKYVSSITRTNVDLGELK